MAGIASRLGSYDHGDSYRIRVEDDCSDPRPFLSPLEFSSDLQNSIGTLGMCIETHLGGDKTWHEGFSDRCHCLNRDLFLGEGQQRGSILATISDAVARTAGVLRARISVINEKLPPTVLDNIFGFLEERIVVGTDKPLRRWSTGHLRVGHLTASSNGTLGLAPCERLGVMWDGFHCRCKHNLPLFSVGIPSASDEDPLLIATDLCGCFGPQDWQPRLEEIYFFVDGNRWLFENKIYKWAGGGRHPNLYDRFSAGTDLRYETIGHLEVLHDRRKPSGCP
jgi:hypothetical protein